MPYDTVLLEKGPVAHVVLNRPEARNALSVQLIGELMDVFREVQGDDEVRVVVLRGAGDAAFCAGADLTQAVGKGILGSRWYFQGVADIITAMGTMTKPIIGAVHGFALAGGCGIAAACDVTIASEDAVFGLPEINIGLAPMTVMAPIFRCVGRKKGLEFVMKGERIDAHEAESLGLVTRVVPRASLFSSADELANNLASKSPAVLQLIKEAFYTMTDMEYFKSIRYMREMIAITASTDDAREGVQAFFEKRKPQWRGT